MLHREARERHSLDFGVPEHGLPPRIEALECSCSRVPVEGVVFPGAGLGELGNALQFIARVLRPAPDVCGDGANRSVHVRPEGPVRAAAVENELEDAQIRL